MNNQRTLSYNLSQELTEGELSSVVAAGHWSSIQVGDQRGGGYVQIVWDIP